MEKRACFRDNWGFTAIEMMIIIAIVGLLVGLAVPNYMRFRDRARQAEAKSGLTTIFQLEKNYQVLNNTYTACIAQIGFSRNSTSGDQRYYTMGFNGTALGNTCGPGGGKACLRYIWNSSTSAASSMCAAVSSYSLATAKGSSGATLPTDPDRLATLVGDMTRVTFTARATGNIGRSLTSYDRWTINESKSLINSTPAY